MIQAVVQGRICVASRAATCPAQADLETARLKPSGCLVTADLRASAARW